MSDNLRTVELHDAWVWDCDECGLENFEHSRRFEGSEEDLQELREEHGIGAWEAGKFHSLPSAVQCRHCKTTFETTSHYDDEIDE